MWWTEEPSSRAGSRRVLVVDDAPEIVEVIEELLGRMGYVTQSATDGSGALVLANAFRPGVILLDIGLPGTDGYEVCRELRARPATRDTIVVAISGRTGPEHLAMMTAAGFDDHLVKPFGRAELLQLLGEPSA